MTNETIHTLNECKYPFKLSHMIELILIEFSNRPQKRDINELVFMPRVQMKTRRKPTNGSRNSTPNTVCIHTFRLQFCIYKCINGRSHF